MVTGCLTFFAAYKTTYEKIQIEIRYLDSDKHATIYSTYEQALEAGINKALTLI